MPAHSRKISWYFTWAVIDIIVAAILISFILSLPIWRITNVEVLGNNYLVKEKIVAIAKVPLGENVFMIDPEDIYVRFKDNILIKKVRVHRKLPATIILDIHERQPYAIVIIGSSPTLVDPDGYIIAKQNLNSSIYRTDIEKFPVILGVVKTLQEKGTRLGEEDRVFMNDIVSLLSKFLDISSLKIDMANKDNINVFIEDLLKVKIGDVNNIEKKTKTLKVLLDSLQGKWEKIVYIDVRVPENPSVKFK